MSNAHIVHYWFLKATQYSFMAIAAKRLNYLWDAQNFSRIAIESLACGFKELALASK